MAIARSIQPDTPVIASTLPAEAAGWIVQKHAGLASAVKEAPATPEARAHPPLSPLEGGQRGVCPAGERPGWTGIKPILRKRKVLKSAVFLKRAVLRFALLLALCTAAAAQEAPPAYVRAAGEATVRAVPAHVEFHLQRAVQADTTEAALDAVLPFEDKLREALVDWKTRPANLEVSAPAVTGLTARVAEVSARLRFPMAGYASPDDGVRNFGKLCDEIRKLAEMLECGVTGPLLLAGDPDELERTAIIAAAEKAFPHANAIAGVLESSVYAVENVEVVSVEHNAPRDFYAVEPNLRQVSCTAKVSVLYSLLGRP